LDAFTRIWFNAGTKITTANIMENADILTLENMYVFSSDVTKLNPPSIKFRFQGVWFEDEDKNLGNGNYEKTSINPGEIWPTL